MIGLLLALVVYLGIGLVFGYWSNSNMETFDIPININITAENEHQAEEKVAGLMKLLIEKPALERAINSWDFIVFVEEEGEDPIDTSTIGI